jgi:hypothetical protein
MIKSNLLTRKPFGKDVKIIKNDEEIKHTEIEQFDINDLEVRPSKTEKSNLPQTKFMKEGIINKFPSMLLNVGRSGSGKSTVIAYLMRNPNFIGNFYDKVYLFSPTADVDDLTKILKIPKKNRFTKPREEDLDKILDDQNKLIEEKGIKHTAKKSKVLIIFDDIVSHAKFLRSDAMIKLATMGRHYLVSSIINTQSYTKIPRAIRLQANSLILFPSNQNEVELVAEDITPPHHRKKDFLKLIDVATEGKHNFLFVNLFEEPEKRFRKNFSTYLTLE